MTPFNMMFGLVTASPQCLTDLMREHTHVVVIIKLSIHQIFDLTGIVICIHHGACGLYVCLLSCAAVQRFIMNCGNLLLTPGEKNVP